jgi:hypothetical protein
VTIIGIGLVMLVIWLECCERAEDLEMKNARSLVLKYEHGGIGSRFLIDK